MTTTPSITTDLAIIGAGPAGIAAAAEALRRDPECSVTLIDMNARRGGQYWRHGPGETPTRTSDSPRWHHGWKQFRDLSLEVDRGIATRRITYLPFTHVWALHAPESEAAGPAASRFFLEAVRIAEAPTSHGHQQPIGIRAKKVIYAPGTFDRHLPVPGWTLPGVMAAGGIQAFIKTEGQCPGKRVVLAGTGPFLLAAADSVVKAGGEVVAIVESSTLRGWFPGGIRAALVPSKAAEGVEYVSRMIKHRIPYLPGHAVTRIRGDETVHAVEVSKLDREGKPLPGTTRVFDNVDLVGLGWGFTPQTELLVQVGADTRLDVDGSLVGCVTTNLESSVPGLFLAGEVTGVSGALSAVAEGAVAACGALAKRPRRKDLMAMRRHRAFARVMHRAHPIPAGWMRWLDSSTTICRCEEVSFGDYQAGARVLTQSDPRSIKGETRIGMGMCQGRMCGFASQCMSTAGGASEAARSVARRPVGMPTTLGAIAGHGEGAESGDS